MILMVLVIARDGAEFLSQMVAQRDHGVFFFFWVLFIQKFRSHGMCIITHKTGVLTWYDGRGPSGLDFLMVIANTLIQYSF